MPRPDVSAERKEQILAAAGQVFLQKGFDAARMEDIAEASGLSIGGVYWYFKGKQEVILALMDGVTRTDLQQLQDLLTQPGAVLTRLDAYIRASLPPAKTLSPLFHEIYSRGGRDPLTRERLRDYFRAYREVIEKLLRQGVERGEFRPINLQRSASLFAALYEGMLELAMLDPENINGVAELLDALAIIHQGLRPERN